MCESTRVKPGHDSGVWEEDVAHLTLKYSAISHAIFGMVSRRRARYNHIHPPRVPTCPPHLPCSVSP